ncbi:MAG: hypothetical protein KFF46_05480, partial [Desulfobacterales bacterium]|nr:hypothetical protein [Desulfobacterales bacterium]
QKDLKYESNNHTMRIAQNFDFPTAVIIQQEAQAFEIIQYYFFLNSCFHVIFGELAKLNASFLLRCHESYARFFVRNARYCRQIAIKKLRKTFSGIRFPGNVFALLGRVDNGKNPFRAEKQNKYKFGMKIA